MTKKKVKPDDPAQAERFARTVRDLEAAGELNPTEADKKFEQAFRRVAPEKRRN